MKTTIYNGLTRTNIEVELVTVIETIGNKEFSFCHYELNGERLYRSEIIS